MKRQIILILLFTLSLSIIHAELSEQGFIMDDIDQMGMEPFDFVVSSTELTIDDQAISFQFHLNYDAELFTYNGYEQGSELNGMLVVNDLNPGLVNVAYAGSYILEGSLELITVNLTPLAECDVDFTISDARYNNTDVSNITGGNVLISGIPELGMVIEDVAHQGLTPFEITVLSNDIAAEDGIISYQFEFELPYGTELLDYSCDESLTGELVVNNTDPGLLSVAYAGFDPISGVTNLLTVSVITEEYGEFPFAAGNAVFNNFIIEELAIGYATVYPAWEEIVIEADGADVFTGDQFTSYISTSPVMLENNIISAQGVLNYDVEMLQFIDIADGSRLDEFVVNASEPGVIQIAYASSDPVIWDGAIIGFVFEAIDDGVTEIGISEFVYNNTYIDNLIPGAVTITNPNFPPVAVAGADFEILEGEEGMLDGSGSYDPNEDVITYYWEGELAVDDPQSATPVFTAPEVMQDTDYAMTLTVDDGEFQSTDEVIVTVINVPNPADAIITVQTVETSPGEDFEVSVYTTPLDADYGVISFQYILEYDPEMITYTGYADGDGLPEGVFVVNGNEPGVIQVAYSSADAITNPEDLSVFYFTANELGSCDLTLSDFYYNNISVTNITNGIVSVFEPFYFADVYVEDFDAGLELEFTCNVMTDEILADWNVISYQFDLYYDPEMLEYTGYQLGDVPAGGNLLAYEIETGHLSVAFADYNPLEGAGSLAGFNFLPLELGETVVSMENFKYNAVYLPGTGSGLINIEIPYANAVISAPDVVVAGGHDFTVEITSSMIEEEWEVISFQFDLGFDAELIEYTGYRMGEMLDSGNLLAYENADGNVSIAFANYTAISGEGTLVELDFTAAPELGESVLDIENFKYNSLYLENVNDGSVSILDPFSYTEISAPELIVGGTETFNVAINTTELNEAMGAISFQFDLGFDPEVLQYVGYENGSILDGGNLLAFENADGNVSIAYANYEPIIGEGSLIELQFTSTMDLGESVLDIENFKYNSTFLDNIVDGYVTLILPYTDAMITCSDVETREGNDFTISISTSELQSAWEIISFQFDLGFDPSYVEYVGYTQGSMLTSGSILAHENETGNISVAFADYMPLAGVGELIELEFSAVGAGEFNFDVNSFKYNTYYLEEENMIDGYAFIHPANYPPVAVAGPDQYVMEGDLVQLNGGASYDPDDNIPFRNAPDWSINPPDYEYNGFIWGVVQVDGIQADNVNDMIGVFVGDECRGVAQQADNSVQYMEFFDQTFFMPMVFSNVTSGETLTFKYYDASNDMIYDVDETMEFTADMVVGDGYDPYVFNVSDGGGGGIPDWSVNVPDFEYSGFIWGVVQVDGVQADDVNDLLGVFVDDECRGLAQQSDNSVQYMEYFGQTFFMPMVFSNVTSGETLTFKYYDASSDMVYDVEETLPFVADMVVGDGFSPFVFNVTGGGSGSDLIFNWIAPEGIVLDDPTSVTPQFTAPWIDEDTQYVFGLEVSDGIDWSELDEVVITVADHPISDITVSAPQLYVVENDPAVASITTSYVQPDMYVFNYQFDLAYDINLMTYDSYTAGELSPELLIVNVVEPGFLHVAYAASTQQIIGEGSLIDITFNTFEGGVSPLDLSNVRYNNTNVTIEDGLVVIENINEPPVFDLPESFEYNEDGELIVDFSQYIEDPDNDSHTILPAGNVHTTFEIDGYIVTMGAEEDWYGSEAVTFMIDDGARRDAAFDMAVINVLPVNDPPEFVNFPPVMYFDEDTDMVFDVGMYAEDVDGDELMLYVNDMSDLGVVIDGLVATITAPEDWNGEETLSFTIDDQQNRETSTDYCLFIVEPVNDAPELSLPEYVSFEEDETLMFDVNEYAYDMDMDELEIISVEYDEINIFFDVAGMMIDFSAEEDWFGSTEVTVTITDNAGRETATSSMLLEVTPVNDAPVMDLPEEMYFDEDTELIFDIEPYVSDVDGDILELSVDTPQQLYVEIDGLVATITAPVNWNGEELLLFTVSDNQSRLIAQDDCNIIVNPMEDDPILELPDSFSFNEDEEGMFNVLEYGGDPDDETIEIVSVIIDEPAVSHVINGENIIFSAEENWNGNTNVEITITDLSGEVEVTDNMIIEVMPVNDAPTIELPDSLTFAEDEILEINFAEYVNDIDGDDLVLTANEGVNVFAAIEGFDVTITASENWFGEEIVTFNVSDQQDRAIASDDVVITVLPVNDAPIISSYLPEENQLIYYEPVSLEFSIEFFDIDSDAVISWYMNENMLPGMNEATFPITFDTNGIYSVRVEVFDGEFTVENTWEVEIWMGPDWLPVTYPSMTTAYSRVTVDGQPVSELDMVGAYVDGEMRGWVHPEINEEDGNSYATVIVYGTEIEEIDFVIYDYSANEYYNLYETFTSNPGGEIGTPPDYIILNFGSGDGPNWTPVVYTNSTILYANVTIEGIPAEEGDRIAAFVGSQCRAVTDVVVAERTTAYATLVIQGDIQELAHFKIWDSSADMIYNVPTTVLTEPGEELYTPPNQITLNGTNSSDVTQSIGLGVGWNLISVNVYPVSYLIEDVFSELIAADQLNKVKNIFTSYDPNLPSAYNTLTSIEDGGGYYVNVNTNANVEITGPAVNVNNSQIELDTGWNLVGYLPQYSQPVTDALTTVIETLLKVKDSYGSYDPTLPDEFNTLETMSPGTGYWIQMFTEATLIYPAGTPGRYEAKDYSVPVWQPVIYTNSTVAYGNGFINNNSANGVIAAFAGDECRAAGTMENGIISLVVNGEEVEEISFKLYADGSIYESENTVLSNPGEDISGMKIFFGNDDAPQATKLIGAYPNPFNPETTVKYDLASESNVNISIYNVKGQLVNILVNQKQDAGSYQVVWNAADNASGIYFMRLSTSTSSQTQKVILMK